MKKATHNHKIKMSKNYMIFIVSTFIVLCLLTIIVVARLTHLNRENAKTNAFVSNWHILKEPVGITDQFGEELDYYTYSFSSLNSDLKVLFPNELIDYPSEDFVYDIVNEIEQIVVDSDWEMETYLVFPEMRENGKVFISVANANERFIILGEKIGSDWKFELD